jgi:hypothetical protein
MCNSCFSPVDFTDLDDLDTAIIKGEDKTVEESVNEWGEKSMTTKGQFYEEQCTKCRGTGQFVSWSGRVVGKCFTCKGEGVRRFRTSPEQRAKAKAKREEKKVLNANKLAEKTQSYKENNSELVSFLADNAGWSDFYASLLSKIETYGGLTENQENAVKKAMAKTKERVEARLNEAEDMGDMSGLLEIINRAKEHLQTPKIALKTKDGNPVLVYVAKKTSKYAGSVMISDGGPYGNSTWYGYITEDGKWVQYSKTKPEFASVESILKEFIKDPAKVAAEYGSLTGNCCFCRQGLTDSRSTEVGYGPVCADHYGLPWG